MWEPQPPQLRLLDCQPTGRRRWRDTFTTKALHAPDGDTLPNKIKAAAKVEEKEKHMVPRARPQVGIPTGRLTAFENTQYSFSSEKAENDLNLSVEDARQ